LSDEQLAEELTNPFAADAAACEHLAACPACREEYESLRRGLARYREEARAAAERPESFWLRQRTTLATRNAGRPASRRLSWAAVAAVVVLTAVLLIEKTPPQQPTPAADPDHALLVDVEHSVRRQVPRALEPAALLAQEVSRSTGAQSSP
jgi:predicted anti-sigma-YlaC factor YlaD